MPFMLDINMTLITTMNAMTILISVIIMIVIIVILKMFFLCRRHTLTITFGFLLHQNEIKQSGAAIERFTKFH